MKFFIMDLFSKCDQISRKLRIWSHLLQKLLMENFIFCAIKVLRKLCFLHLKMIHRLSNSETYSEPFQTSKIGRFVKPVYKF